MRNPIDKVTINKASVRGIALLICLSLAGAANTNPPPGGGGNGNGKGGGGKGGGKTSLTISFPDCPGSSCGSHIYPDTGGDYVDGVGGVQAFLNTEGEEIVFNTGKIGDDRDIYWDYGAAIELQTGGEISGTASLDRNDHRTLLDVGRNAGVSIRNLTMADDPVAIDMWGSLTVNLTGKKKDNTDVLSRFESARVAKFSGQRCVDDGIAGGVSMTGTDVTIKCFSEDGGSCNAWDITGTVPGSTNPAIACVFSVFPGSAHQGDHVLGPFRIRATVNP